jgi:WD40 repeat protein
MKLDRVVPVIRFVAGQRRVGSGYRIAGRLVLTAAHCVRGSDLSVWLPGGEHPARILLVGGDTGDQSVDLALIEIDAAGRTPAAPVPQTPCGRIDRSASYQITGCVAVGYPEFKASDKAPFTTEQLNGWIPSGSGLVDTAEGRREGLLTLRAEGSPPRPLPTTQTTLEARSAGSVWAGMSGAAVFAGDVLVGVVAEQHLPEGDGSLNVVPLDWADRLPPADRDLMLAAFGVSATSALAVVGGTEPRPPLAGLIPLPPRAFQNRPDVQRALRDAVAAAAGPVVLAGMGGSGKSVLAARLAHDVRGHADPELAAATPDGAAWVTVGRDRPVAAVQLELARALGDQAPDLGADWRSGQALLLQLAAQRRGLVVLDDVWSLESYRPLQLAAPGVRIVITTRNMLLARDLGAVQVEVAELARADARSLLAAAAGVEVADLPAVADAALDEVGDLALGVAMVGAIIAQHGSRYWGPLLQRLRGRQLDKIGYRFTDYEHATLLRAVQVAVDDLDPEDRQSWYELAVFAVGTPAPANALRMLWADRDDDALDTAERIDRFLGRSLLQPVGEDHYRLHDLQIDVAARQLGEQLAQVHGRLLDRYRREITDVLGLSERDWPSVLRELASLGPADPRWARVDDGYLFDHLVYHLHEAGRDTELHALVDGYDWMCVHLARGGIAGLLNDYAAYPQPRPADVGIIQDALQLSANVLATQPEQLPGHLIGRMLASPDPAIRALLADIRSRDSRVGWLFPQTPYALSSPGGPLRNTLHGHTGVVRGIAVTPDGTRAVSASPDGTLRVWDLATGTTSKILADATAPLTAVAITPDGTRVLASGHHEVWVWELATGNKMAVLTGAGSEVGSVVVTPDGTRALATCGRDVCVWDLASGEVVATLSGDDGGLYALAVTPDGTRAIAASVDQPLQVWDLATGATTGMLYHTSSALTVAVTPDSSRAVAGHDDGKLTVWDLATGTRLRILEGHDGYVRAVAVTPDGTRAVSAGDDRTLRVWDLATGDIVEILEGHGDEVLAVAVTPDGGRVISGGSDHTLRVWDLASGTTTPTARSTLRGHDGPVTGVAVTSDGTRAVSVGSFDGTLRVWDLATGTLATTIDGHGEGMDAVALSPDGARAVTGDYHGSLRVWDLATGMVIRTLTIQDGYGEVSAVAITPDGTRAVSNVGRGDYSLRVWDLATGQTVKILTGHTKFVLALVVTPDGSRAVSTSFDGTLRVWDLATGTAVKTIGGQGGGVDAVAVTPDGTRAVCGASDNTLYVCDLATGDILNVFEGHTDSVNAISVTPDGTRAVSASMDGTIRLWDLATGITAPRLHSHAQPVEAVAVTADGTRAVSVSHDDTLRVWDLATGATVKTLGIVNTGRHYSSLAAVAVTPDGTRAISGGLNSQLDEYQLRVWDLVTGERKYNLVGHTKPVTAVAVTADGTRAISGSLDGTLRVWDLASRRRAVKTLRGHHGEVNAVTVSADGRRAISGGVNSALDENQLRVWDLATGAVLKAMTGHLGPVHAVAVTSDGTRAVSADHDGALRVWDLATAALVKTLTGHTNPAFAVAVTPDDARAISAGDGTVRVWDLATASELARWIPDHAPRTCAAVPTDPGLVVYGDERGAVHVLRFHPAGEMSVASAGTPS